MSTPTFLSIGNNIDNRSLRLLEDLEQNVDRTESKLTKSLRRIKQFVRETEGKFVFDMDS